VQSAIGQEFNLASGSETRIRDLAEMVNEATGNKAGIQLVQRRKWDTKSRLLASIDRARELFGYEPRVSFEDGLQRTIQWFRDNWDKIESSSLFGPGASAAVREMTTQAAEQPEL
jgi:nucleoside-diphosphate-sugar epimerase